MLILPLFFSLITAAPAPLSLFGAIRSTSSSGCATGVHMIVARASTEAPGQGALSQVTSKIQQQLPGSDAEAVSYPASLLGYQSSEGQGVAAMIVLIEQYAARCPNSKIALLGYSQGAQVIGDVFCGTSSKGFKTTTPLSTALRKNIVAVVQMGDPSHLANQPQDIGTSKNNGIYPRLSTAACGSLSSIAQSYCTATDPFCDSGLDTFIHYGYIVAYGNAAVNWVVSKAKQ